MRPLLENPQGKPEGSNHIYTIGYEGKNIGEFIGKLKERGVKRLVDVRQIALSRKKGFSKTALSATLNSAGIEYLHLPELGSPTKLRKELYKNYDYVCFFRNYSEHLKKQNEKLDFLQEIVKEKASALMCFERVHSKCHRSIIANALQQKGAEVVNI